MQRIRNVIDRVCYWLFHLTAIATALMAVLRGVLRLLDR